MLGATPPRRICSSSTRKDNETLSILSATRESENFPGKLIRWSVATDPVIKIATDQDPSGQRSAQRRPVPSTDSADGAEQSAEVRTSGRSLHKRTTHPRWGYRS